MAKTRKVLAQEAVATLGIIVPDDWTKAQIQAALDNYDRAMQNSPEQAPDPDFKWDPWAGPDQGWTPASPLG